MFGRIADSRTISIWLIGYYSGVRNNSVIDTAAVQKQAGRSRSFLAAEAISAYLDTNEWQVAGITTALSSLDRGMSMAHSRVSEWVTSWETCRERPAPKRV
jgi:RHH-type transcriptional regulator, rel operon repressor / antitoxin RelB